MYRHEYLLSIMGFVLSIFFEPGKEVVSVFEPGKEGKLVFEPGKKECLSLNQERKDKRRNRILLIYSSFLSWFKTKL